MWHISRSSSIQAGEHHEHGCLERPRAWALTAYGGIDDHLHTIGAGYQQHVTKPVMPDEPAAAVAALARQAV